jgi:predicted branched-subunit amino acid permease
VLGSILGSTLADPESIGLDAAFAALFLGLAMPYVRGGRAVSASLLAAVITLTLLPIAPAGVPFVAAAAACLLGLKK